MIDTQIKVILWVLKKIMDFIVINCYFLLLVAVNS
jgi:hypothetical protein